MIGIPTVIQGAIADGIAVRKQLRRVVKHCGHTGLVQLLQDFVHPLVADLQSAARVMRSINEGAAPEPGLFGRDRVGDHPAHDCGSRRIEPADEKQRRIVEFCDRAEVAIIWIVQGAGNLARVKADCRELGIDGGVIASTDWSLPQNVSFVTGGGANF